MELTKEKSEEVAKRIELIKVILAGVKQVPKDWHTSVDNEDDGITMLASIRTQSATRLFEQLIQEPTDVDYLHAMVDELRKQAHWQESAQILKPSHDPTKNDLLYEQARTLNSLGDFIDGLKKCQELKDKIVVNKSNLESIHKMFI